jgi:hypothetical protein
MTVTLDGKTLSVLGWDEGYGSVASQWDQWVSSQYKRKVQLYGCVRTINLGCVEKDVTWANSLVLYFQQKQAAGSAVVLTSTENLRVVSSMNVLVLGVTFNAVTVGTQVIRYFTLNLQEVL